MAELPRTTTGGSAKDDRSNDDGAIDVAGDAMHHAEDAQLLADSRGFISAWKERLARRRKA